MTRMNDIGLVEISGYQCLSPGELRVLPVRKGLGIQGWLARMHDPRSANAFAKDVTVEYSTSNMTTHGRNANSCHVALNPLHLL